MLTTKTAPASRAPLLVSRAYPAPRQGCLVASGGCLGNYDGVARILEILRNYFDSGAADAIRQQVIRSTQFRRAEQSIDDFIAEFDLLRRKAEPKMDTGAGFPGQSFSILRMNYAGLPRQGKSLAMASSHKSLKSDEVAATTRR